MLGTSVGWNYDPTRRRFLSRAEAIAQGIVPPPNAADRRRAARLAAKGAPPPPAAPNQPPPAAPPPPTGAKVLHFERPTLDEALSRVRQQPAPPVDQPMFGGGPPAPPPAPMGEVIPLHRQDEPDGFAALGGKLTAQGAVAVCGMILRRRGFEPNDPDDEDVERLERGMARGIRQRIGDRPIPLWMEMAAGCALLYMSMGNGARRVRAPEASPESDPAAPAPAAPLPPSAAPAPARVNPTARVNGASAAKGRVVTSRPDPIDLGPSAA